MPLRIAAKFLIAKDRFRTIKENPVILILFDPDSSKWK
jgi:hypothetical protein